MTPNQKAIETARVQKELKRTKQAAYKTLDALQPQLALWLVQKQLDDGGDKLDDKHIQMVGEVAVKTVLSLFGLSLPAAPTTPPAAASAAVPAPVLPESK